MIHMAKVRHRARVMDGWALLTTAYSKTVTTADDGGLAMGAAAVVGFLSGGTISVVGGAQVPSRLVISTTLWPGLDVP